MHDYTLYRLHVHVHVHLQAMDHPPSGVIHSSQLHVHANEFKNLVDSTQTIPIVLHSQANVTAMLCLCQAASN